MLFQAHGYAAIALAAALLVAPTARAQPSSPPDEATPAASLNERLREARHTEDPTPIGQELLDALTVDPVLIAELEDRGVSALIIGLDRVGAHDLQTRLLAKLIAEDWSPTGTISGRPDWYDVEYALRQIEAGDVAGATAALRDVREVIPRIDVMIDRRFERLWPALEDAGWLDARAAIEGEVEDALALRAAHPRRLEAVMLHLSALRRAGRPAEAVAAGAEAREAITAGRLSNFDDAPHYANWVMEEISRSLRALGEEDDARRVQEFAATLGESGEEDNISQVLNGAGDLVWNGGADAALQQIASFSREDVSRYGWTVVLYLRTCSYAQLGDIAAADANLEALEAVRADGPWNVFYGHLCSGRTKDAAATMTWQLQAGHSRTETLRRFQRITRPPPVSSKPADESIPSKFETQFNAGYAEVFEREEVLDAIDRAGRVFTWDVAAMY